MEFVPLQQAYKILSQSKVVLENNEHTLDHLYNEETGLDFTGSIKIRRNGDGIDISGHGTIKREGFYFEGKWENGVLYPDILQIEDIIYTKPHIFIGKKRILTRIEKYGFRFELNGFSFRIFINENCRVYGKKRIDGFTMRLRLDGDCVDSLTVVCPDFPVVRRSVTVIIEDDMRSWLVVCDTNGARILKEDRLVSVDRSRFWGWVSNPKDDLGFIYSEGNCKPRVVALRPNHSTTVD